MSVFFRRRGEPPATTVDVALSGTFSSSIGYVTIDGTKHNSAQTITVVKGTSVTVYCWGNVLSSTKKKAQITLNGTTVSQGTSDAAAEYTFSATDNCSIVMTEKTSNYKYYTADITMPS